MVANPLDLVEHQGSSDHGLVTTTLELPIFDKDPQG